MARIKFQAEDIHSKICAGMRKDWAGYSIVGDVVSMPAGQAVLYNTDDEVWEQFDIPAKDITLSFGVNRIYVHYNSGTPEFANDTTLSADLDVESSAPIVNYVKDGTGNQPADAYTICNNAVSKLLIRNIVGPFAQYFNNNPATVLSSNASDHVLIEALNGYQGPKSLPPTALPAFDSSSDDMYLYEYDGASWTKVTPTVTTYERTQYQGPTGFQAVTSNNWTVNYVFRSFFSVLEGAPNPKETFIVLGTDQYVSSALALEDNTNVSPFAVPPEVGFQAVLVGRIIAQNGAGSSIIQGRYFEKPLYLDV